MAKSAPILGDYAVPNLVYERVDDRLAWQIYKFRSGPVPHGRYL
jgi:hypothetical protein